MVSEIKLKTLSKIGKKNNSFLSMFKWNNDKVSVRTKLHSDDNHYVVLDRNKLINTLKNSVDKKFIKDVEALTDYLGNDEEESFWSNCECEYTQDLCSDINNCHCEANDNHIWKVIVRINKYLSELKK